MTRNKRELDIDRVYVVRTKRTGFGVFADRDFKKGEKIFVCRGKLVRRGYRPDSYKIGPYWMGIGKHLWLNPPKSNPLYWLNHSCEPNAGFNGKVTIVAMRRIKKGEEIMIDYSVTEEDPYWWMRCKCGVKNCRKIIGPVTSLAAKTFREYGKFVPPYFRSVYLKQQKRG